MNEISLGDQIIGGDKKQSSIGEGREEEEK